jgi:putative ABC transport system permease protein
MMDTFLQDLRFGWRMLLKSPGFTAVAVLSLALGIGANTTIFTLINAVFLHPVMVADAPNLVAIFTTDQRNKGGFTNFLPVSKPNSDDIRERARSFSGVFASQGIGANITRGSEKLRTGGEIVSGNYFEVLGVKPMLGNVFSSEDDRPERNPVVVLTYGLWQRQFGADRGVIGSNVILNGHGFTVIGVMPAGFAGTNALGGPDFWVPIGVHDLVLSGTLKDWFNERRFLGFFAFGRLKPGVSRAQAEAELKSIGQQLEQDYPVPNKGRSFTTVPFLQATINPNFRGLFVRAGGLLMTVVGLVLLIACANIANLLLARANARRKEVSLKLALGASRRRLITQLMTESLMLSFIGGALGLGLAFVTRKLLMANQPPFVPVSRLDLSFDVNVLLFTLGIAMATGLIFGLVPAIQISRPDLVNDLKEKTGYQPVLRIRSLNLRSAFVVSELALSLITLVGAGLFLFSLRNAQRINPGFDADRLAVLSFNLGSQGYDLPRAKEFYRRALEQVRGLPGVQSATVATDAPLFACCIGRSVFPEGEDPNSGRSGVLVRVNNVGENYLQTVGIPLVRGQDFDSSVREDSPKVAIVSEAMAGRFWPNQDPIGKRFLFFFEKDYTQVIGVAKDSKYNTIGEDPTDMAYLPLVQNLKPAVTLFVRTGGDPASLVKPVREAMQSLDPQLSLAVVRPYAEILSQGLGPARYAAGLLTIFAGLALLLAAIGIYGVMAYAVAQRTQEIGIRMALGAQPHHVMAMMLKQGGWLVIIGVLGGVLAALFISRLVSNLLYGITPTDPVTFAGVSGLLAAVAMAASYLPARRATKVDPLVALHTQ